MLISHKYKFIFFHVPKTAGTSIIRALTPYCDICRLDNLTREDIERYDIDQKYLGTPIQHLPAKEVRKMVSPEIWNSYFKFAFVRNPYDWVLSDYFYVLAEKTFDPNDKVFINKKFEYKKYKDFSDFAVNYYKNKYANEQAIKLTDSGKVIVDFVGRYENLNKDFKKAMEKVGLKNVVLPVSNKGKHKYYSKYYTQEAKSVIEKAFAEDLTIFGYDFRDSPKSVKKIKIAHIINPVKMGPESDLFIAEPITFETMRVAKDNSTDSLEVSLLSSQYQEDLSYVPDFFKRTSVLKKSVLDVGVFREKRKYPLLKDIIKRAYFESDADYIIYTNADIALMPFFYGTIEAIINNGYDAFVINKRIISSAYSRIDEILMMYSEFGTPHPGFDCFVFKRELFPKFNIGNVCIGIPNVDYALIANLVAFAKKFGLFEDLHATFHIGDEMQTKSEKYKDYYEHNWREVTKIYKDFEKKGFFKNNKLLSDLWLQANGKKRIWQRLSLQEIKSINPFAKNNDELAYILRNTKPAERIEQSRAIINIPFKKEKIAFVDISWRQKTGSSSFFIDILKEKYDVDIFWDGSWNGKKRFDVNELCKWDYKAIIFWQVLPRPHEVKLMDGKNVILIPMYDGVADFLNFEEMWHVYRNLKFINFSNVLHEKLLSFKMNSVYFKYFIKPVEFTAEDSKELAGFFWQRKNQINFETIKKLIGDTKFGRFYFHSAPDPDSNSFNAEKLIQSSDVKKYGIITTKWFENKKDYNDILKNTDVYFAPRIREGIGMSFVEAMAMGKCVVAPDFPSMNEYIVNGVNGMLYDANNPKPIDFSNIKEIRKNALKTCVEGYGQWIASKPLIFEFIEKAPVINREYANLINRITLLKNKIQNSSERKFLVVKGNGGGFGNRLQSFFEAVVYAKLTQRELVIDWREGIYAKEGVNSFHEFFESPLVSQNVTFSKNDSIFPKCWEGNLNKTLFEMKKEYSCESSDLAEIRRKFSIDENKLDYDEKILVIFNAKFNINYEKYLNKLPSDFRISESNLLKKFILREHLYLKNDIMEEINNFKEKNFKNKVIGVHIRATDNLLNEKVANPSVENYKSIIDKLLKENPDSTIFLSTDNKNILNEYISKYKNVVSLSKFYPKNNSAIIYAKDCTDRLRMGKDALIDLYLLSQCDFFVFSEYSSFGVMSKLLSDENKTKHFNVERVV